MCAWKPWSMFMNHEGNLPQVPLCFWLQLVVQQRCASTHPSLVQLSIWKRTLGICAQGAIEHLSWEITATGLKQRLSKRQWRRLTLYLPIFDGSTTGNGGLTEPSPCLLGSGLNFDGLRLHVHHYLKIFNDTEWPWGWILRFKQTQVGGGMFFQPRGSSQPPPKGES